MRFEPLSAAYDVAGFRCGEHGLDRWLRTHALANQAAGSTRTYVAVDDVHGGLVAGYYGLTVGSVELDDAPPSVAEDVPPRYPVPVVLLARLAVDRRYQNARLGTALLGDAMLRTLQVADHVGVRALVVHSLNDTARAWYLHVAEFEASPTNHRHLLLTVPDIRHALASSGAGQLPAG